MSAVPQGTDSPAYMLFFLAVCFLVGGLLITLVNPYWNALESSMLFTSMSTKWGQDLVDWYTIIHAFIGLVALVAILYTAFIATRDPV